MYSWLRNAIKDFYNYMNRYRLGSFSCCRLFISIFFVFCFRNFFFGMMVTVMVMDCGKVFSFPKNMGKFILY